MASGTTRSNRRPRWWPRERPIRTLIGFLGIMLGAKVVHRVQFERTGNIPATGPAIIVSNHLATTETLALARLITGHHRFPHFLAKSEIFSWPLAGRVMRAARQIPVLRGSARAGESLGGAALELQRGHVVAMYPEAHLTRRPDLRPDLGKTGAARLALAHPQVPLIPIGMWGAKPGAVHIWHRHTVTLVVGPPIDLTAWSVRSDAQAAREATLVIMDRILGLVEQARGAAFDNLSPFDDPSG